MLFGIDFGGMFVGAITGTFQAVTAAGARRFRNDNGVWTEGS